MACGRGNESGRRREKVRGGGRRGNRTDKARPGVFPPGPRGGPRREGRRGDGEVSRSAGRSAEAQTGHNGCASRRAQGLPREGASVFPRACRLPLGRSAVTRHRESPSSQLGLRARPRSKGRLFACRTGVVSRSHGGPSVWTATAQSGLRPGGHRSVGTNVPEGTGTRTFHPNPGRSSVPAGFVGAHRGDLAPPALRVCGQCTCQQRRRAGGSPGSASGPRPLQSRELLPVTSWGRTAMDQLLSAAPPTG